MTPQIVLSAKARADFISIEQYIFEHDGQTRADMIMGRMAETIRVLAFMPGMGRAKPRLAKGVRAFPISPWIIFYRALEELDGIMILRILDGRRDLGNIGPI